MRFAEPWSYHGGGVVRMLQVALNGARKAAEHPVVPRTANELAEGGAAGGCLTPEPQEARRGAGPPLRLVDEVAESQTVLSSRSLALMTVARFL